MLGARRWGSLAEGSSGLGVLQRRGRRLPAGRGRETSGRARGEDPGCLSAPGAGGGAGRQGFYAGRGGVRWQFGWAASPGNWSLSA